MTDEPTRPAGPAGARDEGTAPSRGRGPRMAALLLLAAVLVGGVGAAPPATSALAATAPSDVPVDPAPEDPAPGDPAPGDPAPVDPAPTDPVPPPPTTDPPTTDPPPTDPAPRERRALLRWGAGRVAAGPHAGPAARLAGLARKAPPAVPKPRAAQPTPPPTTTPPRPGPVTPPGPAPRVVVTGPSYEAPGGTVPVIVTAWNAPASRREALTVRVGSGARAECGATTWTNPVRRSVSRRCYVTTSRAGTHAVTGVVRVAGRTTTGPAHRFVADGPATRALSLPEVRRIERCGSTGPGVRLTFDDGYASPAQLDRLLTALRTANTRAQFFVLGSWARANPALVRDIVAAGHDVHNHTSRHRALSRLDAAAVRAEIRGGVRSSATPRLLRPPYGAGSYTARLAGLAREQGYALCRWTTDTRDWEGPSAALMVERVRYGDRTTPPVEAGGSILMHMNAPHTAAAIPGVVAAVRGRGLRPVPLR